MIKVANGADSCNESHDFLSKLIQTHETSFMSETFAALVTESNEQYSTPPNKSTWFDEILLRVKKCIPKKPIEIQGFYNPMLNDFFKEVFDDLPLWSAVMKAHFKSNYDLSTCNDTESRFNVIKNVLFHNIKLPARPDIFIKVMLENFDSLAKLSRIANNVSSYIYFLNILNLFD